MAEEIKFTTDEVKQLNDLRFEITGVFTRMGQLQFQKDAQFKKYAVIETELQDKHLKLSAVEETLYKSLNEKYGDGNYDPESGVFTPNPDVEVE